jgi:predicted heme/steroid binding protein
MDEFEMRSRIDGYLKEVCHYSQMQVFATSYYQKNYFQMQIDDAAEGLASLYMDLWKLPGTRRRPLSDRLPEEYEQNVNYEQFFPELAAGLMDYQPSYQGDLGLRDQLARQVQQNTSSQMETENQTEPGNQTGDREEEAALQETRSFTPEELAYYDGKEGRPAYVAVNGIVYDVSSLARWAGGNHFGLSAGRDLSNAFMGCHQGIMDRLNQVPKVGGLSS